MGGCGSKKATQANEPSEKASDVVTEKKKGNSTPLKIIIAGAPASGKGTQCERIVEKFGVTHISTGDLLRENLKNETELGLKAKQYMDEGALVPDDIIIGLVQSRLSAKDCDESGWLLDGFPRTAAQADALEAAGVKPDKFILLDVPDEILVERVTGRRTDPKTNKIYHIKFNPPPEGLEVTQRADDNEETVKNRLVQYHEHVNAILEKYSDLCHKVDGNREKDAVSDDIEEYLKK